ncbi:MAG: hypothetical protein ABID40_03190 [Candidatus Bipolaricaulota bacterium]
MKRACILVAVGLSLSSLGATVVAATEQTNPASIATNPFKFFLGLINVEFELQVLPHVSIHVFAEYLVGKAEHPDLVIRVGPRYYPFAGETQASRLLLGLNLGYVWFKGGTGDVTLGAEAGWKAFLNDQVFLLPRALLISPLREGGLLPGFEVLVGATMQP